MNVLSLFDGISCGQLALKRAGIPVEKYFASEVCNYSMSIAKKNFPETIEIGDVRFVSKDMFCCDIDLLIGGSPCQNFSFAGRMNGASTKDKVDVVSLEQYMELKNSGYEFDGFSYLIWEFVRVLKEIKPKYFLLENVKMAKKWESVITKALGVEPILINSELVSAQNRERLYWTNIPNLEIPKNKNISISDIEEYHGDGGVEKFKNCVRENAVKEYNEVISSSKKIYQFKCNSGWQDNKIGIKKTPTLRWGNSFCLILDSNKTIRPITITEAERLQTLPDGYTEGVSKTKRFAAIGNGWTVDVIAHIFGGLK